MTTYRGAAVLLGLWLVSGCKIYGGQTKGENGTIGFYEPNSYPADGTTFGVGFERPIALGARADAWVLAPGVNSLMSATVDDDEVVSLSLPIYPIVLRAKTVGSTTMHVSTSSASDSLALTVKRADGARLWHPSPTGLSFGVSDSFFGKGAAYRAGASLNVSAEPMAGSQPLLGFDLFTWSADASLLSHSSAGSPVNTERFVALGNAGVAQISTQLGGSYEMVTLANSEVPTLKTYRATLDSNPPPEITALMQQDVASFLLGATDSAGHYVVPGGKDDSQFRVDVTAGTVTLLEAKLSGHYVSLRACTGSGTVRISYLGAELSLPIDVTAAIADKACP